MKAIKHYSYTSSLHQQLEAFVAEKRAMGYKFNTEAQRLWHFDKFVVAHGFSETAITKEMFELWSVKTPNESESNRVMRYATVQKFSKFLIRIGIPSYLSNARMSHKSKDFKAYIFTDDEIGRLLKSAHEIPYSAGSKVRYLVVPMLFTTLVCAGLRIGEALNLERKHVVFDGDIVFLNVYSEKYDKQRLIPLGRDMSKKIRKYLDEIALKMPNTSLVFPSPSGNHYKHVTIQSIFSKLLWKAKISYGGRGKGPRIHDIRHTFAVKSLRKLALSKKDPNDVFHFLSTYMGHENLSATQDYIQLTSEIFPYIIQDMEAYVGHIIPALEVFQDEAN